MSNKLPKIVSVLFLVITCFSIPSCTIRVIQEERNSNQIEHELFYKLCKFYVDSTEYKNELARTWFNTIQIDPKEIPTIIYLKNDINGKVRYGHATLIATKTENDTSCILLFITAKHVVEGKNKDILGYMDTLSKEGIKLERYSPTIKPYNEQRDLAFLTLKISARDIRWKTLTKTTQNVDSPDLADFVYIPNLPYANPQPPSIIEIQKQMLINNEECEDVFCFLLAPVPVPGMSGSPVFTFRNENLTLIGLLSSIREKDNETYTYATAIPKNTKEIINGFKE